MKATPLIAGLLFLAGCAAASGYDPKRYANSDAGPQDPDTVALAPTAKTTIPDPKKPAPPPSATPPPRTDADADSR